MLIDCLRQDVYLTWDSKPLLPIVDASKMSSNMSWFCVLYFIGKACLSKQVQYDSVYSKLVFDVSQQFSLCGRIKKNKKSESPLKLLLEKPKSQFVQSWLSEQCVDGVYGLGKKPSLGYGSRMTNILYISIQHSSHVDFLLLLKAWIYVVFVWVFFFYHSTKVTVENCLKTLPKMKAGFSENSCIFLKIRNQKSK